MGQTPSVSMDACVALQVSVRAGSRHRRRGRATRSSLPRLTLISASVLLAFASSQESFGLPTGEALNPSQVTVARPSQSQMVINQSANKALINWQGFSIGAGESVNVKQPSAGSVLLNRVVGPQASDISGQLTANGQVFVLNPNGITFGPKARVDVGGLVASTLRLTDEDFYAGRYQFTGGAGAGSVRVESGARLNAQERGFVALIGGQVSNAGTVTANLGTVAMAAGDKVKLDFAGDGLIQLKVDAAALNAEVANQGAIIANGGKATMTVAAANAVGKTVINQTGIVRAQTLVERNGRIVLESVGGGDVMASGELDARGVQAGTTGGTGPVAWRARRRDADGQDRREWRFGRRDRAGRRKLPRQRSDGSRGQRDLRGAADVDHGRCDTIGAGRQCRGLERWNDARARRAYRRAAGCKEATGATSRRREERSTQRHQGSGGRATG